MTFRPSPAVDLVELREAYQRERDARDLEILARFEAGADPEDLGRLFGLTTATVTRFLREALAPQPSKERRP